MVTHRRTLGLILAFVVVAACSTYGGEDAPSPAPDRDAGDGDGSTLADGPSSSDGSTSPNDSSTEARCSRATKFGQPIPVPGITTADQNDGDARFTGDELQVFFNRYDTRWNLWTATRAAKDQPFTDAVKLANVNGTTGGDLEPAPSFDGRALYFTTDRAGAGYDIWVAKRATNVVAFDSPVKVDEASSVDGDRNPYVAPDGQSLWFDSSRGGLSRIYRMNLSALGIGTPEVVPLAPESDNVYDESPVISSDGLALYFASSGRTSSDGGTQIYMATRAKSADPFGPPVSIATSPGGYAAPSFITADECRLYVTITAPAGEGTRIYMIERSK